MAKYDITYSCGHAGIERLTGPTRDRERRINWLAHHALCAACLRQQHADAGALSTEICRQAGLADLAGSDRQIGWANQLRVDALKLLDQMDDELTRAAIADGDPQRARIAEFALFELDDIRRDLLARVSAKEWIDGRDTLTGYRLREILAERLEPLRPQIEALSSPDSPISRDDQREIYRIVREQRLAELAAARKVESQAREAEQQAATERKAAAAADAQEAQARRWASRDDTARILAEAGITTCTFTVWIKAGEKRIYLDSGNRKIAYYATGNRYHRPGSIENQGWRLNDTAPLAAALAAIADKYSGPVRFDCCDGAAR